MARPKAKAPARRYHLSGQSVVTIAGRDIYLGPHDSPESIARYAVLIGIYQAEGMKLPEGFEPAMLDERASAMLGVALQSQNVTHQADTPILVKHVTALFREHARVKYGSTPTELNRHNRLCDQIDEFAGEDLADKFGPVRLKEYRDSLVGQGLARKYVNRLTRCVVAVFKHAVAGELIDVSVWQRLETLETLRQGQTTAPEKDEVLPANIEHVRETAKHLSPIVKAMLRVQIATGMRPKELCMMRPCDIDRSGEVWIYNLSKHKTAYRGKKKSIPIVGDARDAITDYLQRDPEAYCFSPAEAVTWKRAVAAAKRTTPLSCGNRAGKKSGGLKGRSAKRQPGDKYETDSYHRAITRAAKQAGVPHWFPYQLRHLTATVVRSALGIEDTKALLGHSTAAMTAHYARESIEAATRAAKAAPKL